MSNTNTVTISRAGFQLVVNCLRRDIEDGKKSRQDILDLLISEANGNVNQVIEVDPFNGY